MKRLSYKISYKKGEREYEIHYKLYGGKIS